MRQRRGGRRKTLAGREERHLTLKMSHECLRTPQLSPPFFLSSFLSHTYILYGSEAAVSHIIHSQCDIEKRERRNGKMETHQRLGPITEMQETECEYCVVTHSSTE